MAAKGGAEVHFAKKLANNDKTARDRAVKRLQAWIAKKPSGGDTNELDLMKLWKGLFYCMWFSDKPLIQEELAHILSRLIHHFSSQDAGIIFVVTFFKTIGREWHGIDRLRLDKFYQLIRFVIREFLQFLMLSKWDAKLIDTFNSLLFEDENGMCSDKFADGVKIFFAEIFVEELKTIIQVEKEALPDQTAEKLLKSGLYLASTTASVPIHRALRLEFFGKIISCNVPDTEGLQDDEGFLMLLNLDYNSYGNAVFEFAGKKDIPSKSRKRLFSLLKMVKAANGYELKELPSHESELPTDNAAGEGDDMPSKKKKKKKTKRISPVVDGENGETLDDSKTPADSVIEEHTDSPAKKKKKRKKKTFSNDDQAQLSDTSSPNIEMAAESHKVKKSSSKRSGENIKAVSEKKKKRKDLENGNEVVNGMVDDIELNQNQSNINPETELPKTRSKTKKQKKVKSEAATRTSNTISIQSKADEGQREDAIDGSTSTEPVETSSKKVKSKKSKSEGKNVESTEQVGKQSLGNSNKPTVILEDSSIKAPKPRKTKKESSKNVLKQSETAINETPHAEFVAKTPVRLFVKKSASKAQKTKEESNIHEAKLTRSEPQKKKVTIALSRNKSVVGDHLKFSPVSPFEPSKKPGKGLLKTPNKRSKAEDYF